MFTELELDIAYKFARENNLSITRYNGDTQCVVNFRSPLNIEGTGVIEIDIKRYPTENDITIITPKDNRKTNVVKLKEQLEHFYNEQKTED